MSGDFNAVKDACCNILDAMMGEGLSSNFYIGFVRFASSATEIGYMNNVSQLESMKSKIRTEYGQNGGTVYSAGLNEAINMINRDLLSSSNTRIIVFMTDGSSSDADEVVSKLKNEYGVDGFFAITYGGYTNSALDGYVDMFEIGESWMSNASNITDTFKNILYQINEATPEMKESIDGRLEISDIEVSADKPIEITVEQSGIIIKQITITEYPTSTEGVIFVEAGTMYLNLEALAAECGLDTLEDVDVSISYFSTL